MILRLGRGDAEIIGTAIANILFYENAQIERSGRLDLRGKRIIAVNIMLQKIIHGKNRGWLHGYGNREEAEWSPVRR